MSDVFKLLLQRRTLFFGILGLALGAVLVFLTGIVSGGFWVLFERVSQPGVAVARLSESPPAGDSGASDELRAQLERARRVEGALRRQLEALETSAGAGEMITVAEPCLNLRLMPNEELPPVDCLLPGTWLRIVETGEIWSRVSLGGLEGWVARRYLAPASVSPSSGSSQLRAELEEARAAVQQAEAQSQELTLRLAEAEASRTALLARVSQAEADLERRQLATASRSRRAATDDGVSLDGADERIGAQRQVLATADPCLNLRRRPDTESPAVDCLPPSARVTLLDPVPGWSRVRSPDGREGWVAKSYLGARSESKHPEPRVAMATAVAAREIEQVAAADPPQLDVPPAELPPADLPQTDGPPSDESPADLPPIKQASAPIDSEVDEAPEPEPALTAPPIVARESESTDERIYRAQIVSRRNRQVAEREIKTLRQTHATLLGDSPAHIQQADLGDRGTWHRVQFGAFGGFSEARALCARLEQKGLDCLVIASGRRDQGGEGGS